MKMPYETQGEWEGRGYGVEKGEHTENNHERGPEGGGGNLPLCRKYKYPSLCRS